MKKISIITVTYNCVEEIERTILSVINQDYPNIEYIIIDGASKDGTVDVIKKYLDKISYWISEPDKGIYDAMNKGIKVATGDYINFMNAGDSFVKDDVVRLFTSKIEEETIIAHGDIYRIAEGFKYRDNPPALDEVTERMPAFHQASFINKNYHSRNLYDLKYRSAGDYNFYYQACLRDNVLFQYIPMVVANFDCCRGTSNVNYKLSLRERALINGRYSTIKGKIKLELQFIIVELYHRIRKLFFSNEEIRNKEIIRLKKSGKLIELL